MADSSPHKHNTKAKYCFRKLFFHIFAACVVFFSLFQIHFLVQLRSHVLPTSATLSSLLPFGSAGKHVDESLLAAALDKLRHSVTFLPLKDLRYTQKAMEGHTWFMSSLNDTHLEGDVQHQHFPSHSSRGRLLCMKGHHHRDGARNYYALAWPEALPENATLMKGLTFVSYNHYDYNNLWHGLSAMVPFGAWYLRDGCRPPARWVMFHWGELRVRMGGWITTLMETVYGPDGMKIELFEGIEEDVPVCFEEAVVMRHNEGGMSRLRLLGVYDLFRCRARAYCNVTAAEDDKSKPLVGVTMLMRTGGRSFKNDTLVIGMFESECRNIQGCRLQVAYSSNLTFCQQVQLMSETDVLISPHGAQLANMFLMEKGSNVMEFFPKGWLQLAGVGQHVLRWLASWSGMSHEGAWRDPDGPPCQYPENDRRCMSVYKNAQIGHNEKQFQEWARTVFNQARARKLELRSKPAQPVVCGCLQNN